MSGKSIDIHNVQGGVIVGGNVGGNITNRVENSSISGSGQRELALDLIQLAEELSKLRAAMKQEAQAVEHDIAVSEVAKAEQAARAKDGSKLAEHLKAAGQWALDIAAKIGIPVAVEAIKQAAGLK